MDESHVGRDAGVQYSGRKVALTIMNLRIVLIAVGLCLGLIVCLCCGVLRWVNSQTTYYVEVYKPAHMVTNADEHALKERFTMYDFKECAIGLEWFTYDNQGITSGPYKLFVVLDPKSATLTSVELVEVRMASSSGNTYEFDPAVDWPARLVPDETGERSSYRMEPAFPFDFDGGEIITTDVTFRINTTAGSRDERIHIRWMPVRVKLWTSLV